MHFLTNWDPPTCGFVYGKIMQICSIRTLKLFSPRSVLVNITKILLLTEFLYFVTYVSVAFCCVQHCSPPYPSGPASAERWWGSQPGGEGNS